FFFQAEDGIRDATVTWSSDVCSSDLHTSWPVAALRATTLRLAVVAYNTPWTTMGLTSSSVPTVPSLESNVHATWRRFTLARLIRSEERRVGKGWGVWMRRTLGI